MLASAFIIVTILMPGAVSLILYIAAFKRKGPDIPLRTEAARMIRETRPAKKPWKEYVVLCIPALGLSLLRPGTSNILRFLSQKGFGFMEAWPYYPLTPPLLFLAGSTLLFLPALLFPHRWRAHLIQLAILVLLLPATLYSAILTFEMNRSVEPCTGCSSFAARAFSRYSENHDGWYPRGGKDEWDSLAIMARDEECMVTIDHFTNHYLSGRATALWESTGTFDRSVSCFRYNEGLRSSDPDDLILLYQEWPGKNGNRMVFHPRDPFPGHLPEAAFRQALEKTRTYLKERGD